MAMPFNQVVEYIIDNAGKQFDPTVVKAFEVSLDDIKRLYNGIIS